MQSRAQRLGVGGLAVSLVLAFILALLIAGAWIDGTTLRSMVAAAAGGLSAGGLTVVAVVMWRSQHRTGQAPARSSSLALPGSLFALGGLVLGRLAVSITGEYRDAVSIGAVAFGFFAVGLLATAGMLLLSGKTGALSDPSSQHDYAAEQKSAPLASAPTYQKVMFAVVAVVSAAIMLIAAVMAILQR